MYHININTNELHESNGVLYRINKGLANAEDYREATQAEIDEILNPQLSEEELFTQELSALNASFESDVKSLSDSMANAMLTDGINEQSRIDELRARYAARKAQHDLDELELMQKYGLA